MNVALRKLTIFLMTNELQRNFKMLNNINGKNDLGKKK